MESKNRPIRIPKGTSDRIDKFLENGEFQSYSDFMVYSARFYLDLKEKDKKE